MALAEHGEVMVKKIVCCLLFGFLLVTCPTFAQEIIVHGGATSRTDASDSSYAWGLTYLQGWSDYAVHSALLEH